MATSGADIYGFNPFPGALRDLGPDCIPGPLKAWRPSFGNARDIAWFYGVQRWSGLNDRAQLNALSKVGIGS